MKTLSVLAAALLSVFALAACGSSSSDDGGGSADAASSSDDRDTARLKLQECLRKQGVGPPPRSGSGPRTASASERRKVEEALRGPCKEYAQGAVGNMSEEQRQEFQDAFAKFASCMRSKGIDIPNITPGQGPPAGSARINRNSAKFKAAMEACEDKLPEGRGGPGPGDRILGSGAPS